MRKIFRRACLPENRTGAIHPGTYGHAYPGAEHLGRNHTALTAYHAPSNVLFIDAKSPAQKGKWQLSKWPQLIALFCLMVPPIQTKDAVLNM